MKCTLHHGYSSPAPQQMLTHCYLWTDHECQIIFFCLLIISHQLLLALVLLALPTRGPPQSSSRDSFPRKAIANHWRETANLRPCERCPVGKYWTKYDHQNQTLPNLWGHGQDLFQWHKRHTNRSSEPAWACLATPSRSPAKSAISDLIGRLFAPPRTTHMFDDGCCSFQLLVSSTASGECHRAERLHW